MTCIVAGMEISSAFDWVGNVDVIAANFCDWGFHRRNVHRNVTDAVLAVHYSSCLCRYSLVVIVQVTVSRLF